MEIIGTVGAVVGLVGAIGSVSKALDGFIRTMRLADRDAYLTHTELTTLGHLLMHFDQLVSNHDSQGAQLNGQSGLQNPVLRQGKHLIRKMKRVLKEIGMFDKGDLQTGKQRWLSRFRWYIRKKEVLQLCVQFNQIKVSIMAFVSMVGLESVRDELQKVRDEMKKMYREQLPGYEGRIARLREIRKQLERRV
ncbi:hypothetical protein BFW01_g8942 [Lasiodiplodia theobromae]|nr:hypothetical protein BFW01_g8942 [Lasiodiplodia theobromae]